MAKAYKCDRCGEFFCKKPNSSKNYNAYHNGSLLDLCDSCQTQLYTFLSNPETTVIDPRPKSVPYEPVEGEGELYDNEF